MDVDEIVEEIRNLKNSQDNQYYDNLFVKIQEVLNGNYSEKEKEKLRNTGRLSTIYMLSSFS